MSAEPVTAIKRLEDGSVHRWCCGTSDVPARMARLGDLRWFGTCLP